MKHEKLMVIALVGLRKLCEREGANFLELVAKAVKKNDMTLWDIEKFIDEYEEKQCS